MNNSRWKMNRIGLLDFWYYDDQEFYFLDGKMLLRGSNGSGKSVTMQSFIPLLLDGNMRPERLDPFGSRARKMENYLLEDGDGREERTGYLYMEFKRKDVENYLTIGIGLRARRGKKLDPWYFCITDGRRIGKDIYLYKDVKEKIAYSKMELRNRIGNGGRMFDSQKDYAAYVNQTLFGFETMDEYREMLELLIQLRTPKLSKDFKPTVINDILGSSLQTLSEDDLRTMSEAMDNMDSLNNKLEELKKSRESAIKIRDSFNRYNLSELYNKSRNYYSKRTQVKKLNIDLENLNLEKEEILKVATKYPHIAKKYFKSRGQNIEIIKLNGSVELAPIVGLSDVIVDLVETGNTLKVNGLEIVEDMCNISSRIIANRVSYKFNKEKIENIVEKFASTLNIENY